ncbi:MAG: hypothetical protein Q4G07_07610 [Oscillospiraceae bacterium]|nr:hypothetical protein [Oscillospiraceae bacterium]
MIRIKKYNFKFIVSMDDEAVKKLDYIAEYYGRDRTNLIRWLVRNEIIRFETEHGKIDIEKSQEEP